MKLLGWGWIVIMLLAAFIILFIDPISSFFGRRWARDSFTVHRGHNHIRQYFPQSQQNLFEFHRPSSSGDLRMPWNPDRVTRRKPGTFCTDNDCHHALSDSNVRSFCMDEIVLPALVVVETVFQLQLNG